MLTACGAPGTGTFGPTAAFQEVRPASIFVIETRESEAAGATRSAEGGQTARRLIEENLRQRGYRVGRGAQATLFFRVDAWRERARLRGGSQGEVALSARLVQDSEGELLWIGSGRGVEEPDERDRDQGLLDNLFDAAVGTAVRPWLGTHERLAEEAVLELLQDLPEAPLGPDAPDRQ